MKDTEMNPQLAGDLINFLCTLRDLKLTLGGANWRWEVLQRAHKRGEI